MNLQRPYSDIPLEAGTLLHSIYQIQRLLGEGGFGRTYLARQLRLDRDCAVKQLLIPVNASSEDVAELQRVFEREAKLLVELNNPGHPNIPEIYDYFSEPSGNFLVMKYIQGDTLDDQMAQRGGRLPWQEAVKVIMQICSALDYMHARQPPVLHRDIKPANIMLDATGRAWLIDFGLSKAQPSLGGKAGPGSFSGGATTVAGTPGYTPLEQWLEQAVPPSDIYALSATLHHLVSGRDPRLSIAAFDLQSLENAHGNFPPIRSIDADLPSELEVILVQGVAVKPELRPTASEWLHRLTALIAPARSGISTSKPFHFASGEIAHNIPELARLCELHWDTAKRHLYRGDFEDWLARQLTEHGIASQAEAIRRGETDQDAGLERFLHLLDPDLPIPQLQFSRDRIIFILGSKEPEISHNLTINHSGPRGYISGEILSPNEWLQITPKSTFGLKPGEEMEVQISLDTYKIKSGVNHGEIRIAPYGLPERQIPVQIHLSILASAWNTIRHFILHMPSGLYFLLCLIILAGIATVLLLNQVDSNNLLEVLSTSPEDLFDQDWLTFGLGVLPMLLISSGLAVLFSLRRESRVTWQETFINALAGLIAAMIFGAINLLLIWAGLIFLWPEIGQNIDNEHFQTIAIGISAAALSLGTLYGASESGATKVRGFTSFFSRLVLGIVKLAFWIGWFALGGWLGYLIADALDLTEGSLEQYASITLGAILVFTIVRSLYGFIRARL